MNIYKVFKNKVDVKNGDISYGAYIGVKRLLAGAKEYNLGLITEVIETIHKGYKYSATDLTYVRAMVKYFNSIVEGIAYWGEKEAEMLYYEPSDEELRAGVREYSQRVGETATIKAIAKNFGQDPDQVLSWKYSKVFGILYTDLEEYKYSQRFNKVLESKYK